MSQGKGSKRRSGVQGAYEEGWERIYGRKRTTRVLVDGREVELDVSSSLGRDLTRANQPDSDSARFGRLLE